MSLLIRLALIAAAIAAVIGAYTWWRSSLVEEGVQKERAVWVAKAAQDAELLASDRREQRVFSDRVSAVHAANLARINNQLGEAREKIARLPGRTCLDGGTVRVLNNVGAGDQPGGAPASQPAGTPEAAASDQDVGEAIATCRAYYGEVSSQLNQILDIEDKRHPLPP